MLDKPGDRAPNRITTVGLARLMRAAYRGDDLGRIWRERAACADLDPSDAGALMDLSTILQLAGHRDRGLDMQQRALTLSRVYHCPHGTARGLKVLGLVVAGDFMANTPLDFLLEGSDIALTLLYLDTDRALPDYLPEHDVCFLAVSESADNQPVLEAIRPIIANWPRPVVNGAPERIAQLTRDGVCAMFKNDPDVVVADTVRCRRTELASIGAAASLTALLPGAAFPLILRPLDSHAGAGLARVDDVASLHEYLDGRTEGSFYLAPFIDYRSPDGLFRKQRIAFIGDETFGSHLAISSHWMVHYLSAGMEDDAGKRAEEGRFFEQFDADFVVRHRAAFERLRARIGLDYFTIDCAELPDGRLFLFEVDVAMIVHDLDPETLYPYKKPAMAKLFSGFQACLEAAATVSQRWRPGGEAQRFLLCGHEPTPAIVVAE